MQSNDSPQVQVVDERRHDKQSYVEDRTVFRLVQEQNGSRRRGYPEPSLAFVRRLVKATLGNLKQGKSVR